MGYCQPGQNQFVVWNTDSNGDYVSNATGILSTTSYPLENLETTFGPPLIHASRARQARHIYRIDGSDNLLAGCCAASRLPPGARGGAAEGGQATLIAPAIRLAHLPTLPQSSGGDD
jgi:hypothetical protein